MGSNNVNISDQKARKPVHITDFIAKSSADKDFSIFGSVVLPNQQVLITDSDNSKVKLIDTSQNKILSEIHLPSDFPYDITTVNQTEYLNSYAVTLTDSQRIQFLSVNKQSLSLGRAISVNGQCRGLVYNSRDRTFIVTYILPGKVEIINMAGTVVKSIKKDRAGEVTFKWPNYVALSPSMGETFVSDETVESVTRLTSNGEVKTVYKDSELKCPKGICVHKSSLVYVVGYVSNTVHQLDPDSGEFKTVLEQKDGIKKPLSVSYCELEDKIYIGMENSSVLKVFQMN